MQLVDLLNVAKWYAKCRRGLRFFGFVMCLAYAILVRTRIQLVLLARLEELSDNLAPVPASPDISVLGGANTEISKHSVRLLLPCHCPLLYHLARVFLCPRLGTEHLSQLPVKIPGTQLKSFLKPHLAACNMPLLLGFMN